MAQSRTRCIGLDGHTDAMAAAYGAQDHGAEVTSLGTLGTRQCDIAQLVRQLQAQATPSSVSLRRAPGGPGSIGL